MKHTKDIMTVKEYGGHDSLYIDGKCWCSGVSKEISHRLAKCWNSRDPLLAALENWFEWHADHFEDFGGEIDKQLLCLATDTEIAIAEAKKG